MFADGNTAEIGFANVDPSLPAVKERVLPHFNELMLTSFSALTGSVKQNLVIISILACGIQIKVMVWD